MRRVPFPSKIKSCSSIIIIVRFTPSPTHYEVKQFFDTKFYVRKRPSRPILLILQRFVRVKCDFFLINASQWRTQGRRCGRCITPSELHGDLFFLFLIFVTYNRKIQNIKFETCRIITLFVYY